MTREIKFKVWDLIQKKWLDNFIVYQYGNISNGDYMLPKDEYVLCQYTGLKDKKGEEIYDGYILKVKFGKEEEIREVKWGTSWASGSEIMEIIGNIYEK